MRGGVGLAWQVRDATSLTAEMGGSRSLIPQGLDGIESRGLARRQEAEDEADDNREGRGKQDRKGRDLR